MVSIFIRCGVNCSISVILRVGFCGDSLNNCNGVNSGSIVVSILFMCVVMEMKLVVSIMIVR